MPALTRELAYLLLIVGLIIVPRVLQRYRIPAPLTSFAFGMAAALLAGGFDHNETLALLATLGISSLFLFAGLEIELADLRRGRWMLLSHLVLRTLTLAGVSWVAMQLFGFRWQVAALLSLALLTPSTGFILDTLPALGLDDQERHWIKIKAIGGELLALLALFVVLQSGTTAALLGSSAALLALIVGLPMVLTLLVRVVVPHAPGSEFSLLVMVGLIAAYCTFQLGVYYLVGAFLAGFIARLLRRRLPRLASHENLHAIQMFASFFVPFYFFHKGLSVPTGALTWDALWLGLAFTLVVLPLRVGLIWTQRRFVKGETARGSLRVAVALTPTLIFTLVLATILRDRFQVSDALYGGLLFYAGVSTLVPSVVLAKSVDFNMQADPSPEAVADAAPRAGSAAAGSELHP